MNLRILILDHHHPNLFMIEMVKESTLGKSEKEINYIDKESLLLKIVWKWDLKSNIFIILVSFHLKIINLWRNSKRFTLHNKLSTMPKQTTLVKLLVHKDKPKKLFKNVVDVKLLSEEEVLTKKPKIFFKTFNHYISLLSLIMMSS